MDNASCSSQILFTSIPNEPIKTMLNDNFESQDITGNIINSQNEEIDGEIQFMNVLLFDDLNDYNLYQELDCSESVSDLSVTEMISENVDMKKAYSNSSLRNHETENSVCSNLCNIDFVHNASDFCVSGFLTIKPRQNTIKKVKIFSQCLNEDFVDRFVNILDNSVPEQGDQAGGSEPPINSSHRKRNFTLSYTDYANKSAIERTSPLDCISKKKLL
ncbi:hypothetical protein CWI38_1094p0020 [Hamiltosporidium tvaerminnensis]|uniref:Uncharacterized protein n=2 Tax=Hamiltosporidium TaxID=1176354 RepID=A0A4Q9L0E4_9MICR|nr:hypothetical protein LUQ84_001039 [Hamiltosporidium tvaerminnensis]TBU00799.1 hypothetical protein CWI39_1575p0010 [Hamiltosporidium magnivora]TBU11664.1 hypothetical protein CWI38_1094p0020 [Hamiltosporidium tvaerminnensis]